ncbi:MAG: hypothetical protein QXL17_01105 [Candidatus Thermoplasmatota archaeon]
MDKNAMIGKLSIYAFMGGTLIAILVGLWQAVQLEGGNNFFATNTGGILAWILAIIGAIVGILAFLGKGTITKEEVPGFLMAGVALLVMYAVFQGSYMLLNPWIGSLLTGISLSLAIFIVPAVGLLAIKAIWDIGKSV